MILAIWLKSWSPQTIMKSANISSTTGRRPVRARANAHAHEPLLRDGGILYTQITILVPQTHGALEVAADDADVLAHLEYGIIPRHLLVQGLPDGVSHHQFSHDLNLPYYQTDAAISTNTSL